jgi:hypothetical protein
MVARMMDRIELIIRDVLRWSKRWWQHSSTPAKYAVLVVAISAILGSGYGAYRIMFAE